jgi:hypothetical protein
LREWQNKFLEAKQTRPLYHEPPKVTEQTPPPPVGPSAKKAYLSSLPKPSEKTDEEILEAARQASANGNGVK